MGDTNTTLMIILSETLKDELLAYAGKHDKAMAAVVREAIAAHIGFDLVAHEKHLKATRPDGRGRPRIYASKDAQRSAQRQREREQRALATALMSEFERKEAQQQREALAASIEAKEARQQRQ